MASQFISDQYVEWAPDSTEDFGTYWYANGLMDGSQMYCAYDAGQTPTTIYPPTPKKVLPPSGPAPIRPPSAPPIMPPAPRIRRPKSQPLPY